MLNGDFAGSYRVAQGLGWGLPGLGDHLERYGDASILSRISGHLSTVQMPLPRGNVGGGVGVKIERITGL